MNPIQGQPSSAFMESLRKARASDTWQDVRILSSSNGGPRGPGPKTKLVILAFVLVGVGMFIAGASIYWSGDYGEDQRKTGLDLLACSCIPLLPGIYGAVSWVGHAQGWHGYASMALSYD